VFSLVSLSGSSAKIGIAGGSYESGAATVTLAPAADPHAADHGWRNP
jgi:hypothetical protein